MKFQVSKGLVCTCFAKFSNIFLFLVVFVLILTIYVMDILEFQDTVKSFTIPTVTPPADMHNNFCTFQPLPPKEALEEQLLLESIDWPETPPLSSPLLLNNTSDPAHSTFTILPRREGGQWRIGDKLEVMIKMYDFLGHPKKSGGDFILARLHNLSLGAGVAGQVVDHLNGSYSAVFSLLWEGGAQVEVILVHPSEAVMELRRLNRDEPDRIYFESLFRSGSISENSTCNVCLRPTQQSVCNYTDLHTGDPWFCYKPKSLSCDARINHYVSGYKKITTMETLFQRDVNMKVSIPAAGPASVTVFPIKGHSEVNSSSVESGPSGYYYQGMWQALGGTTVHQFNTSLAITECLKDKVVHMYGDSTIRQWFEFLNKALPALEEFNPQSPKKNGPFMALDYANNILVTFRIHAAPLRSITIPAVELRYIANEIDSMTGGSNTVVVFGIWAHFGTFPVEVYIRRLMSIRRAVVRLLSRAPDTVVIIRTGNPKNLQLHDVLTNSDWYSLQWDKVLRAMFKGLNVHLVDAWEMVLAHHLPHYLHPQPPIIQNMINVLLSYICPVKGG